MQQAAARTFQTQVAGRFAVRPAMDLSSAIKSQAQQRAAAQQVRLEEERVNLAAEKQDFDESQTPWAIAGGALSAGVQLLGGWDALRSAREAKGLAGERDARTDKWMANMTAAAERERGVLRQAADTYNRAQPPKATSPTAAMFDWNLARRSVTPYGAWTFTP